MDATHLHLALNHAPVFGTIFALGLLLYGLWRRSDELKKTVLGFVVVVTLLTFPAYFSGESAAEKPGAFTGISNTLVEQHDEAAALAFTGVFISGLLALTGLILFRRAKPIPTWFCLALMTLLLIVSALMVRTANLGGQIRHPEARPPPAPGASTAPPLGGVQVHSFHAKA